MKIINKHSTRQPIIDTIYFHLFKFVVGKSKYVKEFLKSLSEVEECNKNIII